MIFFLSFIISDEFKVWPSGEEAWSNKEVIDITVHVLPGIGVTIIIFDSITAFIERGREGERGRERGRGREGRR